MTILALAFAAAAMAGRIVLGVVADRQLMLRQGDHLIPLVQAGVHDGHIFVETWDSYGPRSERGDRW